jgi:hypothetical protein
MMTRLNSAQVFWLLFAGVLLASAVTVITLMWPARDAGVVADLRSPECVAMTGRPGVAGTAGDTCAALRELVEHHRISIRSEDDYGNYLATARLRIVLTGLGAWAIVAAGIYFLGWSSGRLVGTLQASRGRKITAGRSSPC